ncbi:MAG: ATP-binding protein [Bacteroidales bacterium]|nr:ATP-binding protein [Bacteroidales bacterium]MCF8458305.1 ATP-binding protein [Bacteroidales bacterium]
MISNTLFELYQNKKDLYHLMETQSHTLLESIMAASENSLKAIEILDDISEKRILNNVNILKKLYEKGQVSNVILNELCRENKIDKLIVFTPEGLPSFYGTDNQVFTIDYLSDVSNRLFPLYIDRADTLDFGVVKVNSDNSIKYQYAVSTVENGAIFIEVDAARYFDFKRKTGFGPLLRNVAAENSQIIYIAYQDSFNILAATGNITELESIGESAFLSSSIRDSSFMSRKVIFHSSDVFETVHPFTLYGQTHGLLRMGLSTAPMKEINARIYRRLIIIGIALLALGFMIFIYLFTQKQFSSLQKDYKVIESYSSKIIDNVSDAIVVYNPEGEIRVFNRAASLLFDKKIVEREKVNIQDILPDNSCPELMQEDALNSQVSCLISGLRKTLLISKSSFLDNNSAPLYILVAKDLTEQIRLQEKLEREERLTAMGELAAGVAHEIRNPLNTISTIVQQLSKDFEPVEHKEDYYEFTEIVYSEVNRINSTVKDFLRFARPEPVKPDRFEIASLFEQLHKQYKSVLDENNIQLTVNYQWQGEVNWDVNQMKQVFINLIQNSIDALGNTGTINIEITKAGNNELKILVADNGPGMSEKTRKNLFNLYYTTKPKGTGIGLSIVQRIVYEHGGFVSVESEEGKGSVFSIILPLEV